MGGVHVKRTGDPLLPFCSFCIQGEPKSKPLRLTVYTFETSELICVFFGTLQLCFFLNTSVNSILNKFITPMRHLMIKSPTQFSLAKSSETTAFKCSSWYFKYACYFIFINCLVQSDAIWQKTKTRYSVIINS